MSTYAFGALSAPSKPVADASVSRRQLAPAATTTAADTKVGKYVTVLAALVPAEALAAHAAIVAIAVNVDKTKKPPTTTLDKPALQFAFWGLIVVCVLLYVAGKYTAKRVAGQAAAPVKWTFGDVIRAAVGPCAFVAWTMIQKGTAFDAVAPKASEGLRNSIAIVVAVGLTAIAAAIGYKAPGSDDDSPAPPAPAGGGGNPAGQPG